MKSSVTTTTIIPLLSLLFATSAEQLSASRLRKLRLQEALTATYTDSNANTDRALDDANMGEETDITDLVMVVNPCLEYSFEGSVELPDDDPCSPTYNPTAAPSKAPTSSPTNVSTDVPTNAPTSSPSREPTSLPTNTSTDVPTDAPTSSPSREPTPLPTTATDVGVVGQTPAPTSQLTASPTTSPVKVTKEAGNIPIPVPEPCCDSCSCYDDDDSTEYTDSSADGQYSYQYAGRSSKSSKSSKSGKSGKSSKSSSNNRIGVDTTTLRGSELLAFRDARNSSHSANLSFAVAIAIAVSISTLF